MISLGKLQALIKAKSLYTESFLLVRSHFQEKPLTIPMLLHINPIWTYTEKKSSICSLKGCGSKINPLLVSLQIYKWLIGNNVSQLMSIGSGWVSSRFYSSGRWDHDAQWRSAEKRKSSEELLVMTEKQSCILDLIRESLHNWPKSNIPGSLT